MLRLSGVSHALMIAQRLSGSTSLPGKGKAPQAPGARLDASTDELLTTFPEAEKQEMEAMLSGFGDSRAT